jgi:nucleotide-binding universal stress UspA family protein
MKPIMLATDGSPSAEAATREALDLAEHLRVPLLVASVMHELTPAYGYYGYAEVLSEMRKIEHERIESLLASVERTARERGVACKTMMLDGLPGERLCRAAEAADVRLVVIGAHGWGRLGRLIHGSVSTYVLHHAEVPVLVVHGDDEALVEGEPEAVRLAG